MQKNVGVIGKCPCILGELLPNIYDSLRCVLIDYFKSFFIRSTLADIKEASVSYTSVFESRLVASALLIVSLLSPLEAFAACYQTAPDFCVDSTPCKTINGQTLCLAGQTLPAGATAIPETCWEYDVNYTCPGGSTGNCQPLIDRGCTASGVGECAAWIDPPANTQCANMRYTYVCTAPAPAPDTVTVTKNCSVDKFCTGPTCFEITDVNNNDLNKTAAMIELARQAAMYRDPATMQFFKGEANKCVNALFGLFNCCTIGSAPGLSNAESFAVGSVMNFGSAYVYDALAGASTAGSTLIGQAYSAITSGSFSATSLLGGGTPSMGFMGVSVSFTPGGFMISFDPASLAISLAVMVIMDMLACTQDEQKLSLKRGQNLCIFVGEFCSTKVPLIGTCLAYTESYCCYNSKLARIINQQGRGMAGKTFGSAESPDCSGFTEAEFKMIDFSALDLTEFINEIKANIDTNAIANKMKTRVQDMSSTNSAVNNLVNPSAPGPQYTGGWAPVAKP